MTITDDEKNHIEILKIAEKIVDKAFPHIGKEKYKIIPVAYTNLINFAFNKLNIAQNKKTLDDALNMAQDVMGNIGGKK